MPAIKKAAGDAPSKKEEKKDEKTEKEIKLRKAASKVKSEPSAAEVAKTQSQLMREEAEYKSMQRKQRFKRRWPEISKVKLKTRKWHPPGPPEKPPKIYVDRPELTTRKWVPPYMRRRRPRKKLLRIPPEEMTQPLYEYSKLAKIWHGFSQVEKNKMMLQGFTACDSKKYSATARGSQTGCIAIMCRALLEEKTLEQLTRRDVDEVIENGDRYYKQCVQFAKGQGVAGKPHLPLNQLQPSFYLHDTRYTVKMTEIEKGVVAKHPDNVDNNNTQDLMTLMDKRKGTTYMNILSVGKDRHFLIWGHPPAPESGSQAKTICYIFDPYLLNPVGQRDANCRPESYDGAGAFLRYAGVNSFVIDFLANHGELSASERSTPKAPVTLTDIDIVQKEPLVRQPKYEVDLKALKAHCRSEWDTMNINALYDKKIHEGQYPHGSLSAVSLATSRSAGKRKVQEYYQKASQGKEPPPVLPVPPDRGPIPPTQDQIMSMRGEDFFLYCPTTDSHLYGRDDMLPRPKSDTVLHSPVEIADNNFPSQFSQVDVGKWILRGTRHMGSYRYQMFKSYTSIPCCVIALAMLRRLRARAWNEDTVDETLDGGYNMYRESLLERGGPIRRLVLGELKDKFKLRDKEYKFKQKGISVWGKILSTNPKVFDLCRGIDAFFKESDSGLLQIPGDYEVAVWNEGGKYYVYHPWPADKSGHRLGLREGGKACLLYFTRVSRLCEHLMDSMRELKRKPFSISSINITQLGDMPEPVNQLKPVAPNRWVVQGNFHEGDERFPEEHRYKQATPTAIAAIAMAHILPPEDWTAKDVDETLVRGDILYQNTIEHLERMGVSMDSAGAEGGGGEGEEGDEESEQTPAGTLAAVDVMNRFKISEYDCIETDVLDNAYFGQLHPEPGSGVITLKDSLKNLFKEHNHAVVTARGGSMAVWSHDGHYYFFDPHGCDENGYPSEEPRSAAVLVRMKDNVKDLTDVIMGNLSPGVDDSYNISPVSVTATKLNAQLGAPENKLEHKDYAWMAKGTAAILMGPRGENTAIGKAAKKAGVGDEDMAGRTIALPAAAAFTAATDTVSPPHMHSDHMYNFLEAGSEYYTNYRKKTGKKELLPEDLTEKFEMGVNTFSIELGEPVRLPLRLPDAPAGEGGEEEEEGGGDNDETGEELEEETKEPPMKQIKDALFKQWYDTTKPAHVSLLVGDYHQMGVWVAPGGKVVAFDPAPTLYKGLLTPQRIKKGDELRMQRLKEEMGGEGGGGDEEDEDDDDEEAGGEGEEKPEAAPEFVPKEAAPVLMHFASPAEFIDKLAIQGGLDKKQCLSPYKLYPVKVTNELTSVLKEKKGGADTKQSEEDGAEEDESADLIEPLEDEAVGRYMERVTRSIASVRGRVAQNENYFMDSPNRDHQDAANAAMAIVAENIEPYTYWKPQLIDGILKYGDRLYTTSVPRASAPPHLRPTEIETNFHVTSFNVNLDVQGDVTKGDIKAGKTGPVLNLARGLKQFFESNKYGILCAKEYCISVWKGPDDKSFCMWDPHASGPTGRASSGGAAALVVYSNIEEMADTIQHNISALERPGSNKYSISSVKVHWELSKLPAPVQRPGAVPDDSYELKVLTAYVETARGRTILRGSRPADLTKFTRDALLQSASTAIVGTCMSLVRKPHLWTRRTVDDVMLAGTDVMNQSVAGLGYEFRPGEDVMLPLQVVKRFVLGVNYVRYDLDQVYSGKLEQKEPTAMTAKCALERFFEQYTHGIIWAAPYAAGVWRDSGTPPYYMLEPTAAGPTGLRADAQDDGAACVLTYTSPKLMAHGYLQNYTGPERQKQDFQLYALKANVHPIRKLGAEPPLIHPPGAGLVPATSKVYMDGCKRRADERDRKHPPGSATCLDAQRASEKRDEEEKKFKGHRNISGWLVLNDGTQFLSAQHSIACRRYPYASRGNQALACSMMAVAMSRVEEVCRWLPATLDQIMDSGDQLYQDSYLHYQPDEPILNVQQVLRKFYTPGNCVCRVQVFKPRQEGQVDQDLTEKVTEFFREEKAGVFVAGKGDFAVALFRTPRGFYMFDPADRDRYGRAVAPPCIGHARACFSQYPNVKSLCEKLGPNIPPVEEEDEEEKEEKEKRKKEREKGKKKKKDKDSDKEKDKKKNKDKESDKEKDKEKVKDKGSDSEKSDKDKSKKDKEKDKEKEKELEKEKEREKEKQKEKEKEAEKEAKKDKDRQGKEVRIVSDKKDDEHKSNKEKKEKKEEPAKFVIYGMDVTSLRKLNIHER